MNRDIKLAIGASLGLGVLIGAAFVLGSAGSSAASGAANQLPPKPSPTPAPPPSPPPPAPPPGPPAFDPTKVTPGTTFTGILNIQPDPTAATQAPPASFDDMSQLLKLASMTPSFAADGSPGQWTVVATYAGTNPTIDLTESLLWAVADGRQYIVSWSHLSTVGANV
jgi:hypothetical protein